MGECERKKGNQRPSLPKPIGVYPCMNCSVSVQDCCAFKWDPLKNEQKRPRLFCIVVEWKNTAIFLWHCLYFKMRGTSELPKITQTGINSPETKGPGPVHGRENQTFFSATHRAISYSASSSDT